MKNITDRLQEKTNLKEQYGQYANIPPLLICNQNKQERISKDLLESSILLKGELLDCFNLNRNQNNHIYERNLSNKPLPVNVDIRPISSSKCADPRFLKERKSLETYNQVEVDYKCKEEAFMPGKGTVGRFFNNIDVDSELKNINQIDTKCSERLFKVDPRDKNTKLSCYSETLVKDYKKCDEQHGSTWCNYNKCGKLESFDKCDSKTFKCVNPNSDFSTYDNMPPGGRLISDTVLSAEQLNSIQMNQKKQNNLDTTLKQQEEERIRQIKLDLELIQQKRDVTLENNLNRNKLQFAPVHKPENITQFKGNSATNVYAPIIRKQKNTIEDGYNLGKQRGLDVKLDLTIEERVKKLEEEQGIRAVGYNPLPENNCSLQPIKEPEVYPFQCREQTRNLYKFNKLVGDSKDCLFCEQLFNNQTKRKHISVSRVPEHIYYNQ